MASLQSWIQYSPEHPFPIQNLPFGVFSTAEDPSHRIGVAIGDFVLDLKTLAQAALLPASASQALQQPTLNDFMALGHDVWKAVRSAVQSLLSVDGLQLKDNLPLRAKALVPQTAARMHLPCVIGDYTDFYASKEHASNLGQMFRPGQPPLLENWLYIPVGYHGRSSSIVVSGTDIRRPSGQKRPKPEEPPVFGACAALDFELEMAAYIGSGNPLGTPVSVDDAPKHIFGFSVFNDWSARDLQKWEYVPLGPFLGKNFASTISPWIVTTFALEPFLVPGPVQDPAPFPYLVQKAPGNYNINLEVSLTTSANETTVISRTNFKLMYWSIAQMVAHHTVNGCNLRPGDVLASGTISGTEPGTFGSMIELAWQGTKPIKLASGAERKMLQDGDTLTMRGECIGDGYRIGFGECTGKILPAVQF
jgi:fumarylacetoacetase